ncbi:MAG: hypothetical protein MI806_32490, partial [Minwuiales bacterium]|nr:hypothetical protein [Minwuiales bacterium]
LQRSMVRLRDEAGLTIVLVEQNTRVAFAFAERTIVMNRGRVSYDGPSAKLDADHDLLDRLIGVGAA